MDVHTKINVHQPALLTCSLRRGWNPEESDPGLLRMGPFSGRTLWNSSNWIKMTSIIDSSWSSEGPKWSVHCFIFFLNAHSDYGRRHQKPRHRCQHIGVRGAVSSYSGALSHYGAIRARLFNSLIVNRSHCKRSSQARLDKTTKWLKFSWFAMHLSSVF